MLTVFQLFDKCTNWQCKYRKHHFISSTLQDFGFLQAFRETTKLPGGGGGLYLLIPCSFSSSSRGVCVCVCVYVRGVG